MQNEVCTEKLTNSVKKQWMKVRSHWIGAMIFSMFILSALLGLFFKNHNGVFIENMSSYVGEFVLGNLLLQDL